MRNTLTVLKAFDTIFSAIPDPALLLDRRGTVRAVNAPFVKRYGFMGEEVLGRSFFKLPLLPKKSQPLVREHLKRLQKGEVLPCEICLHTLDHIERYAELNAAAMEYEGKVINLVLLRDIDARRRAEELLRGLANRASVGIYIVQDRKFQFVNLLFQKYTGYSESELLSRDSLSLVNPEDRETARGHAVTMLKGEQIPAYEYRFTNKEGETRWAMETVASIQYEGRRAALGTFMDITERKKMERRLAGYTRTLESAYERLQKLDQMKDTFLSTVSHELRTPLTSIKGFAEILLSYEEDKETQREFLTIINNEAERLTRLINDLLDLSRIEAGRMQWETNQTAIPEIIATVTGSLKVLIAQKNLKLTVDAGPGLPAFWGDKDRLGQVVTNLISNAIKFTPEGGEIRISAHLLKGGEAGRISDMIKVSVSDTGVGIAPENHENIFQKFTQVENTLADKPVGTGLGLAICKEIVTHYRGRIWVESELGQGSTFSFILPVSEEAQPGPPEVTRDETPPPALAIAPTQPARTILVADDEANVRRFLKHELTHRGYRVIEASNGTESLEMARKHHPDLITLDVLMPGISGFDVTAVLKNDHETRDIPILILSMVEEKDRVYQLGANDYLTKPFPTKVLLDKVARLLSRAKKQRVLVADDDEALVTAIKFELEKRDLEVHIAHDGEEALRAIERSYPDLVVLDIVMPGMGGYDVMRALKSKPSTADIPVIVLTGIEIDGGRVKAVSLGATEYLVKSKGLGKLFEEIDRILNPHLEG